MKTLKNKIVAKVMMMANLCIAPMIVQAQSGVTSAFENIANSTAMIQSSTIQQDLDDNQVRVKSRCYKFNATSRADCALIDRFVQACKENKEQAYLYTQNQSEDGTLPMYSVNTADGRYVIFGQKEMQNLLVCAFSDSEHPDYRICYAIEWCKEGNSRTWGNIIESYTKRPSKTSNVLAPSFQNGNYQHYFQKLDSLKQFRYNRQEIDSIMNSMTDGRWAERMAAVGHDSYDSGKSLKDWLAKFNVYRDHFKNTGSDAPGRLSYLAAEILQACQNHPTLTENVRSACIKSVQELKSNTNDNVLIAVLEDAIEALRKN